MFELSVPQWIPLPQAEVFEFFADAANLEALAAFPDWPPLPISMQPGCLIEYSLRLHGIPFQWTTEITQWQPPVRFEDSQRRGPYRLWRHQHIFESRDGGTQMEDRVTYDVPGGRLIHRLFVRNDLRRIFEYRQVQLPRLLGIAPGRCRGSAVSIQPVPAISDSGCQQPFDRFPVT